jgi:HD-GYP domain-containing protein (c-di-GMP phosphodiesterase class II)
MKSNKVKRLRILYLILIVLVSISVAPLCFFGYRTFSLSRETLDRQERIFQTSVSQTLAQVVFLYMDHLNQQMNEFFAEVVPLAARTPAAKYNTDPELEAALTGLISQQESDRPSILFATVVNEEAQGVQAGSFNAMSDAFVRKALEAAFVAARQGQEYESNPIAVPRQDANEAVLVMAHPIKEKDHFLGMAAAVVTLAPISKSLQGATKLENGLEAYIVDDMGRLVASYDPNQVPGTDLAADVPIVQKFLSWRGQARVAENSIFDMRRGKETVTMLGTYAPIQKLEWGVIVQRPTSEAFFAAIDMGRQAIRLGLVVVVLSLVIGVLGAKSITRPIDMLAKTARSIAQRDFSQRADVRSRTEVGELAENFNRMAEDIQQYIGDLKAASEENRQLFIESIEMIAAAVDAKDPYTKGHSGRVSGYSVILAKELGLSDEEVDKIRISATLHDVGKIGIEDRVLKKPGVLTNEEFELMKRHTVMGYEIVRQVKRLAEMLPGIRWHHETLNGKGYPDGIGGDELPLMVRIISVADTFDAITTDRPYQAGSEFPRALEILRKHAGSKYDPIVVDAMHAAYSKGNLKKFETRLSTVVAVPQAAS